MFTNLFRSYTKEKKFSARYDPQYSAPSVKLSAGPYHDSLAEQIFSQPIPPNFICESHRLYKDLAWVPNLAQYIYIDYDDSTIFLRAGQTQLTDLMKADPEAYFVAVESLEGGNVGLGFLPKFKKIIKKVLFLFDILATHEEFRNLVFDKTCIRFADKDVEADFPRIILSINQDQTPAAESNRSEMPSGSGSRTSQSPTKHFGDFLIDLVNHSSEDIDFDQLRAGEQQFIIGLQGQAQNWSIKFARNHPALWYPMTASRFLKEAYSHYNMRRSKIQLDRNFEVYSNNILHGSSNGPQKISFREGLPPALDESFLMSKYNGWKIIIQRNVFLMSFYNMSIMKRQSDYEATVGGLFQFMRNAIEHFHDYKENIEDYPVYNRASISKANLEILLLTLFPDFIFDVYPEFVNDGYQFVEFSEADD